MSLWDDIKSLFKSKEEVEADKRKTLNDAKEKESQLIKQLDDLEKAYEGSIVDDFDINDIMPEYIKKNELEAKEISDDYLNEVANDENWIEHFEDTNDILSKHKDDKQKTNEQKEKIQDSAQEDLFDVHEFYKEMLKSSKNSAIKNNMVDSSIYEQQLGNADSFSEMATNKITEGLNKQIMKVDSQLIELDSNKKIALENLDIVNAKKIDQSIFELTKQKEEYLVDIATENEKINQENIKNQIDYEKNKVQIEETYVKQKEREDSLLDKKEMYQGYSGEKKKNYSKRLELAINFYDQYPKAVAQALIKENPSIKNYLGRYYDALQDTISAKTSTNNSLGTWQED